VYLSPPFFHCLVCYSLLKAITMPKPRLNRDIFLKNSKITGYFYIFHDDMDKKNRMKSNKTGSIFQKSGIVFRIFGKVNGLQA
jgi:hypothetical protein